MASGWDPERDAPADEDIASCVACGLCLPHCPTFRLTGRETASPRGRIAAMRAVAEGEAEPDGIFAAMMDECLACRACETACPSGVPFGRMVEAARAQVEPRRPAALRATRRLGLAGVFPRRRLMFALATGLGLAQTIGADRLVPRRLRRSSPRVSLDELRRPLPRSQGTGPVAALLTGCIMDVAFRPVHRATLRLLARSGYRAVVPDDPGCCGALAMHNGQPEAAREMARARIAALESADVIVVNSAGCSAHMKDWGALLADDPDWGPRAAAVAGRVRDVIELDLTGGRVTGPVAVHDACHHLNGQAVAGGAHRLLAEAGADLRHLSDGGRCCGAAGIYSVTQPEMSQALAREKAAAIVATGAPVVAVANPGCAVQIAAALADVDATVRVAHPVELLDEMD